MNYLLYREIDENGISGAYVLQESNPAGDDGNFFPSGSLWKKARGLVQQLKSGALDGLKLAEVPDTCLRIKGNALEEIAAEFRKNPSFKEKDYQTEILDAQTLFFSEIDVYEATGVPVSKEEINRFQELLR